MDKSHPTFEELSSFFLKDGKRVNSSKIMSHLLGGCELCSARVRKIFGAPPGPTLDTIESTAWDEKRLADRQWKRLEKMNLQQREIQIQKRSFQTWALFSLIVDHARTIIHEDPGESFQLANLAERLSRILDPKIYGEYLVQDAKAQAAIELANAQRVMQQFDFSQVLLDGAKKIFMEGGTGDPMLSARLKSIEASLCYDKGLFEKAASLASKVVGIQRQIKDLYAYAIAKVHLSFIYRQFDPIQGYKEGKAALDLLTPEDFFYLCAVQNMIDCLAEGGELGEAAMLYQSYDSAFHDCGSKTKVKWQWLGARLDKYIGITMGNANHLASAENTLMDIRAEMEDREMFQEYALAGIDLMEVYLSQNAKHPALVVAVESLQVFATKNLHIDAYSTYAILQRMIQKEELSIAVYLTQARRIFRRFWKVGAPANEQLKLKEVIEGGEGGEDEDTKPDNYTN
jgi:hypothetical protein